MIGVEQHAPQRSRRLLFVSRHYASDFSIKVGGIFQRMRMLLDGAARSTEALDILFFVDQYMIDRMPASVAKASLLQHWGIEATVHLAPRSTKRHGRFTQTALSLIDFREQEDFFRFTGPDQKDALRARVMPDTDLVIAHRLYIGALAHSAGLDVPVVLDLDDIEHRNLARQLRRPPHSLSRRVRFLELPSLKRGEVRTVLASSRTMVCSEDDHRYLATLGARNTTVIPNAIRIPTAAPEKSRDDESPMLFFIGAYGYPPNLDAGEYLINVIFPLVRERLPDARLLMAGEAIDKLPSLSRKPDGVEFSGFVPDLAEVYRRATVVCCPILAGGGTRIKLLEAAAAAKPMVSTTIGAEGLEFVDGVEILLRDTPDSFADACVALLRDRRRAQALGDAAFAKVSLLYDRKQIVEKVDGLFRSHASRRR